MSSKQESWLSGRTLGGRFQIGHLLALGGMSEVYRGIDLWTHNPVAIKVMSPRYSADPSKQQKFYREGNSLAHIQHDNIVRALANDTEQVDNYQLMYLVLEYVHGCTLEQLLKVRRVLSVREMLDIMLPTVEGLAEVHAMHYIHRDLKPSNILISADKHTIKITDFGLTRREDQSWTGELMGTPQFVAPEIVLAGSPVTQSADIFAIGMMIFRMLTGRFPFTGNDQQILYNNVYQDVPALSTFAPGMSSGISGIVSWCTRRQASNRPENATELLNELQKLAASLTDDELDFRAPIDDYAPPHYSWWQDVELIASKSSPGGHTPQVISASRHDPELVYAEELVDEEDFFEPETYQRIEPLHGPVTEQVSHQQVQEDATLFDGQLPAAPPIGAEYRRPATSPEPEAQPQQSLENLDPRVPYIQLSPPPSLPGLVLVLVGLVFALVMAGWLGWWLAQTLQSAQWFQAFINFF